MSNRSRHTPLNSIFLGPKAENADLWIKMINNIFSDYVYWRRNYFPNDPITISKNKLNENGDWIDFLDNHLQITLSKLKAHFPFYSPRYMAHMLSGQTLPSVLGYFAGMLYNPNNVTDEAAPVTVDMEIEFGKMVCKMLGYGNKSWAHICSGGTIANLEALWVARQAQFIPLIIQEFCVKKKISSFSIKLPNSKSEEFSIINLIEKPVMLSLKPNESIFMLSKFLNHLVTKESYSAEKALDAINTFMENSTYSVKYKGFYNVMKTVGLEPIIFVPESAHYSFKKAVNILGYGENSIRSIPLDNKFRINVDKLEKLINNMKKDEYIAAVVAVVGTTEEGAVDPIHQVKFLRNKLELEKNRSFWFHVDAAWGGYIRSLFVDDNLKTIKGKSEDSRLELITQQQIENMDMNETFTDPYKPIGRKGQEVINCSIKLEWQDSDVIKAFLAMPSADSITVDPHKLGFVPYPAGVVAFKNQQVTQLVSQRAQYISDNTGSISKFDIHEIDSVGSYIIEGSKPGAAAISCWLAAKTIPLDLHHHGKIIKTTILNAQRFKYYLARHQRTTFFAVERELKQPLPKVPFRFVPLYDNIDTNIVCFVVIPMKWKYDDVNPEIPPKMMDADWYLDDLNYFNECLYEEFTIKNNVSKDKKMPYSKDFFLSRTRLEKSQYAYSSIEQTLKRFAIKQSSYEKHGLFVLRSTIMNPWYYSAMKNDNIESFDYFMEFIKSLHVVSRYLLNESQKHPKSDKL